MINNNHGKICFVVQRYGEEVNGGAELFCKQLAEKMTQLYEVHVMTTKAIDYITWKNEYKADFEIINNVNIHRFPVEKTRDIKSFNATTKKVLDDRNNLELQWQWVEEDGPYCPELLNNLEKEQNEFDAFIFITYLYYPTIMGLPIVKDKAIFIPTAHDEPYVKLPIMRKVFNSPKAFVFLTDEERKLVRKAFYNFDIPCMIGGAGVDVPNEVDATKFVEKYGYDNFVIYIGRIDASKNCHRLFRYFQEYKRRYPSELKLLLIGKPVIELPEDPDIISLGFVSDEDKFNALAASRGLILPSKFESLSIAVLESLSLEKPVLVNEECEVLKGHIIRSDAGFYYLGEEGFIEKLHILVTDNNLAEEMGKRGKKYIDENYQWNIIVRKLQELITDISTS